MPLNIVPKCRETVCEPCWPESIHYQGGVSDLWVSKLKYLQPQIVNIAFAYEVCQLEANKFLGHSWFLQSYLYQVIELYYAKHRSVIACQMANQGVTLNVSVASFVFLLFSIGCDKSYTFNSSGFFLLSLIHHVHRWHKLLLFVLVFWIRFKVYIMIQLKPQMGVVSASRTD